MHQYVLQSIAKGFQGRPDKRKHDVDIHVSDLINFCPRAYLMCRRNKIPPRKSKGGFFGMKGGYVAKMGHKIQDIFIDVLSNAEILYGTYECLHCDHRFLTRSTLAKNCPKCESKAIKYRDTTLVLQVGHVKIVGNVDTMVLTPELMAIVNECKSMKQEFYDNLISVSLDYQAQVLLYMWMLKKKAKVIGQVMWSPRGFHTDIATISFAVKGNSPDPFKVFSIKEGDIDIIQRVEAKLDELNKHFNAKTLPKKICETQGALMAKDCAARTLCFKQ